MDFISQRRLNQIIIVQINKGKLFFFFQSHYFFFQSNAKSIAKLLQIY